MSSDDAAYAATFERLQAAIAAEQHRHGELIPPPLTEEELAQQGTCRSRASMEREDEFPPNPTLQPANPFTLEDAHAYKRAKNLSAESEVDAEAFLQSSNAVNHSFRNYVATLSCRDKLTSIMADSNTKYKVPETLKKTLQDYSHLAVVSPSAYKYRDTGDGTPIAANVMAVLWKLNVADLPPTCETGRVAVAMAVINKGLTDRRCLVKAAVFATLPDPSASDKENRPSRDIATLTRACIANTPAKATAILYQHIAIIASSGKNDDKFWAEVDAALAMRRKACTTPGTEQIAA
ncbi:hypothetical protein B0H10DRAFT_2222591 [Mycena sp. CBHHK59/15]|nr:hypothetical protein B0H10DRAFT_2222591 [Mycena sp. CBHHK59/15]